jgi:putative FmdB family regulatory protein
MPIYEYKCSQCGRVFEVIQKFSDAPLTIHEGCGGSVERLLTTAALQFKGSGWYITDYAHKHGSGATSEAPSNGNGTASTVSTTKTEAKTEAGSKPPGAPAAAPAPAAKSDSQ